MAARLVTELTGRGYAITAIKHAHESFDIDHPGRDSYRLREAGARRVVLSSPKRWALMHELGGSPEMSFNDVPSEARNLRLDFRRRLQGRAVSKDRDRRTRLVASLEYHATWLESAPFTR
jgi:hypothetical protein